MAPRVEDITTWADLRRYLEKQGIKEVTVKSLERLIKDSEYDEKNRRFIFITYHPYYTEPRLSMLSDETGILI